MDLNKKTMQRLALLITFALLLYWGLTHPAQAGRVLSSFFSLLLPFLLGGCLAFLLNVFLRPIEIGWRHLWGKKYGPRQEAARRPVCLLATTVLLVGVVFAIFFIVVPALRDSVMNFVSMLPARMVQVERWWNELVAFLGGHSIQLPPFTLNVQAIQAEIMQFLYKYGEDFLNTTIGITSSIFSSIFSLVVNLVLGFVFSLYLLAQKETLTRQAKKVLRALCREERAKKITEVAQLTNRTFSNFVTGQLTEAVILGSLCFIGMYEHSYPPAIAVLVIPDVIFEPLSIVIPIVFELTPESSSETFQVNVIVGATFSFTTNFNLLPKVPSVASLDVLFPAVSVALTVTL